MIRYIYLIWNYFWRSVLILAMTAMVVGIATFFLLQTEKVQSQIAGQLEQRLGDILDARVSIGTLRGKLPQEIILNDVMVISKVAPDDTVFTADRILLNLDVWELFFNTVSVNKIDIQNPYITYTFSDKQSEDATQEFSDFELSSRSGRTTFEIIAPTVQVAGGRAFLKNASHFYPTLPEILDVKNVKLDVFLELTKSQQIVDIAYIGMEVPQLDMAYVDLRGQLYRDGDYLEFNGFRLATRNSILFMFGELAGADITAPNLREELSNGYFNLRLDTLKFWGGDFADILPNRFSELDDFVGAQLWMEGDRRTITIRDFKMAADGHYLASSGQVSNVLDSKNRAYEGIISDFRLNGKSSLLPLRTFDTYFNDWDKLTLRGSFTGNSDSLITETDIVLPEGLVQLDGRFLLMDHIYFDLNSSFDQIATNELPSLPIPESKLSGVAHMRGTVSNRSDLEFFASADFFNTQIQDIWIDSLQIQGNFRNRYFEPSIKLFVGDQKLEAESSIQLGNRFVNIWMDGQIEQLDLATFESLLELPETDLNLAFMMDVQIHNQPDLSYGWISADIQESQIYGELVRAHQFYADLDPPGNDVRSFRFTSSFLDVIVDGDVNPVTVNNLTNLWYTYFAERYREELLFTDTYEMPEIAKESDQQVTLDILAEFKDTRLFRYYVPGLPVDASNANIQLRLRADENEIEFFGNLTDPSFQRNGFSIHDGLVEFYANFNRNSRLREYSVVDAEAAARKISRSDEQTVEDFLVDITVRDGRILALAKSEKIGESVTFDSELTIELNERFLDASLTRMELGSPEYFWRNTGTASLRFEGEQRLEIKNLEFANEDQLIAIEGVLSNNPDDEMSYRIRNLNLKRISDFIEGRFAFGGVLTTDIRTQSIYTHPVFEGELFVDGFQLDGNLIGDIQFRSNFNPSTRQFDTYGEIRTPESKYAEILISEYIKGQFITLNGVIESNETALQNNRQFYFDVEIENTDIWYLQLLMQSLFDRLEGQARGTGYVTGTFDKIDFSGDLEASNVWGWPVFFNTRYTMNGPVRVSRSEGVVMRDIAISDGNGGTARLNGNFDFNEFQDERFLNFTLEKNRLMFLNNAYDPDIPFFGQVFGSGTTTVTGSNNNPFVRTLTPISVTSNSSLSIPLLPETSVVEQGRFIHFVDSFNDLTRFDQLLREEIQLTGIDRSFTEMFRLDLLFVADNPANFRLIFDPVTDEVMSASGTGRMRILLEDEQYSMFGRFDIQDGDYTFVGGDIFTRRFSLREGGSIIWDGDPVNARLNVEAAYRSRPNINVLLGLSPADVVQRIPVDLILQITGTIEDVENDFFFEFPNTIDATQNAAVLSILNSEEQKFMQATSLLLTGGFLPVGIEGQTDEFIALTQSRAGQVGVSQLLSAQINSILNANLANLDIDLNLTGFDQADLGIALRLFDDRLVLRRDGQVGGTQNEQTDIYGDLGAKYRISNALTVEVFHRKDASILALGATQAQIETVNGIGLEAQIQFNSWRELRNRFFGGIRGIFVRREDENGSSEPMASGS